MRVSWVRRVVPQWLRSTDPQIRFLRPGTPAAQQASRPAEERDLLNQALEDFRAAPSLGTAADALRFGFNPDALAQLQDSANLVLANKSTPPEGLLKLARAVIDRNYLQLALHGNPDVDKPLRYQIHDTRRWLARFPRDALSWLDLGRLHAACGNPDAARRAVQTALTLNPNSRTVLRSTSRFFLHSKDPEKALSVLEKTSRTSSDPWLMAGHIAISSILGKTSKLARKGRQLVVAKNVRPREVTELASSLATLELESGTNREAKKLFNIALEDPNENSLAQVEWAVKQLKIEPNLPPEWLENPMSAEAGYYRELFNNNLPAALHHAIAWHSNEPFASRPMLGASFIAAITGRLDEASAFARQGLVTEPHDVLLLNNLIFSTGAKGDLAGAERLVKKVFSLQRGNLGAQTFANLGMLSFLRGEFALGYQLYDTAINLYEKERLPEDAAVAATFCAHFAGKVGAPGWEATVRAAQSKVADSRSSLAATILKLLTVDVPTTDLIRPETHEPRRWHYDSVRNALTFEDVKAFPIGKDRGR